MPAATSDGIDRPARARPGPRPDRSRAEIAATAIALADERGLAAVSMRAVAAAMGTAAASLYRYVSSRDDLLAVMVDAVLEAGPAPRPPRRPSRSVGRPAEASDWSDRMVELARQQLELHRAHPWLVEAAVRLPAYGRPAIDVFEQFLTIMAGLPNPPSEKLEAVGMVIGVVSLFARRAGAPADPGPSGAVPDPGAAFAAIDPAVHPHLAAAFATAPPATAPPATAPPATAPPAAGVTEPGTDLFERAVRGVLLGVLGDGR